MIGFAKRNLKVYFRDRTSVFFSLLAVFIIIGLYVLFLGDTWASNIEGVKDGRQLMDAWIMAGLLSVVSLTTTMGAFGTMVDDKAKGIVKDLYATPVRRSALVGGYVIGAAVVGTVMSMLAFVCAETYIVARGGELLAPLAAAQVAGLIVLSTAVNTSMLFLVVSFVESQNAFGTISTVVGTLIGFLTGIYMPIGMMPDAVQTIIKAFPPSHSAVLLRRIMVEGPLAEAFAGAPAEYADGFKQMMGIEFMVGGDPLPAVASLAYLAVAGVVFFALTLMRMSRKKR